MSRNLTKWLRYRHWCLAARDEHNVLIVFFKTRWLLSKLSLGWTN
ncbi:hypothetical protein ACCUM_1641 [Candidatus Accumulibacter phosphatis]|uniref:Uncharacterized protein n=1 Tax=Candidatus Accumulibacter phosphatis TaxID=327160 RepID=A0A5S4FC30_9PROT|nr:hypothetical protein ACCUM_1641 [Candidatus Accumulibacter phosphatis]